MVEPDHPQYGNEYTLATASLTEHMLSCTFEDASEAQKRPVGGYAIICESSWTNRTQRSCAVVAVTQNGGGYILDAEGVWGTADMITSS